MPDDLVERLRAYQDSRDFGELLRKAADEIERLRADITRRYRQTIDQAMTEMRIERDKLISERGEWADSLAAVAGDRDDARSERDKLAADMLEAAAWKAEAKGWREIQAVWKAREDALAARVESLEAALHGAEAEVRSYCVVDARLAREYEDGWNDAVHRVADGMADYARQALAAPEEEK